MNVQGRVATVAGGLLVGILMFAEQGASQPTAQSPGGDPVLQPSVEAAPPASESEEVLSKHELGKADIRKVQSALNEAGYNAGPVDGVWGMGTDRALRDFQQAKGLDGTGQLDQQTILALGFARTDFDVPRALTRNDVRQVQEALNKAGYNVGYVDGIWGPATQSALRDFQRAKGLEPTGEMDQDVVLALGLSPTDFAAGEFQEDKPEAPAE
jgi:peptidoglycan hydrolase-like protein with peptidoglycan-binding domain